MNTSHIEILAPAGSFESLMAAINAGCNSVYFGIADMNMRATAAANFTFEDLNEIVRICKKNNIKSYVTINTLIYNDEIEKMHRIVDAVKQSGATAIIAADMATILYARSIDVEVHVSTQLSISNTETVKFYSQFSDRVVLARELTLEQVKEICDDIKKLQIKGPKGQLVEIEVFAHGALCVAVSGRCAMSLYCHNTSANRGRCTQICRRKYKVVDVATGNELIVDNNYVMSSGDLSTIGFLDKLVDAGVTVLKFEGRGRAPEYVDTVITTYKTALEAIKNNNYTQENIEKWNKDLETVFNRGLSKGYYMGRRFDEWSGVSGSKATREKIQAGTVEKYYPKAKVAQVKIDSKVEGNVDDEYIIIGKTSGVNKGKLNSFHINDSEAQSFIQGDTITFKLDVRVNSGDKFFLWKEK